MWEKQKKGLLLAFVLAFIFISTYSLHQGHRFPYHHDEWQHLGLAVQAMEHGYIRQYNPFIGEEVYHADLEPGFRLFLASFFMMTSLDPVLTYQYLAAGFAVLSALALFFAVYKLTDSYLMSLISIIAFSALKTNVNILGKDFFVPLSMAIPFMFMFIMLFSEAIREHSMKKIFFALYLLLIIFLVHPPSFVILIIPSAFELLMAREILKKKHILLVFSFIILALALPLLWKGNIKDTLNYISYLVYFRPGWGRHEVTYFIPFLYNPINSALAVVGFVTERKLRFFSVMTFISLALTALFNIFGFSLFVPYSRAVHYAMLAMLPLTGAGLIYILQKIRPLKMRYLEIALILLFGVSLFAFEYSLDAKYRRYKKEVLYEPDYAALLWIKENLGKGKVIMTPYFMTSAVYPVSGNKAVSLVPAQMGGGMIQENLVFYSVPCEEKREILKKAGADYIVSRDAIACDFAEEIYSRDIFIYRVSAQNIIT